MKNCLPVDELLALEREIRNGAAIPAPMPHTSKVPVKAIIALAVVLLLPDEAPAPARL